MVVRDDDVAQLTAMGFSENRVRNALQLTSGRLESAIHYLLSPNDDNAVERPFDPLPARDLMKVIHGSTNQYSFGSDGRSACTCIALTAADLVVSAIDGQTLMSPNLLNQAIQDGVSRYRTLRQQASTSVDHMSAEEVLNFDSKRFASSGNHLFQIRLNKSTGIRQGVISRDSNHPLGLQSVLGGLVNDIRAKHGCKDYTSSRSELSVTNRPSSMTCVLITKSPETVLLCVPLTNTPNIPNETEDFKKYWLVDSHPRPQLGLEMSYAKAHDTMESLIKSLGEIFPFTDLGPGVPSMMSEMYNMFDVYPLEKRR